MDLEPVIADSAPAEGYAGATEQQAPETSSQEAPISLRDAMAKAANDIRERDDRANQDGTKPTAFEPKSDTQQSSLPDQAGLREDAAASVLEAPKHWSQKRRDAFGRFTANQDIQKEWLDHAKEMEGEFQRKAQEHAETRKFTEALRESFTPEQRSYMQSQGINEVAAVKWWSDLDTFSRRDPGGYVKWFMQQSGISPEQLFPQSAAGVAPPSAPTDEWQDPEVLKLKQELAQLASQHQQTQSYLQNAERQRQAHEQARNAELQRGVLSTIQQFAESKDEAGNALYPHFNALEERMAIEVSTNPELQLLPPMEKLKAAYDLAAWAHPTTRQALLEAQTTAAQAAVAQRVAAEKAKAAQTVKPRVASTAGASKAPPTDLKSLIRETAAKFRG